MLWGLAVAKSALLKLLELRGLLTPTPATEFNLHDRTKRLFDNPDGSTAFLSTDGIVSTHSSAFGTGRLGALLVDKFVRALEVQGVHNEEHTPHATRMPTDGWLPWTALPEDAVLDVRYSSNMHDMQLPNGEYLNQFGVGVLRFHRKWTARIGVRTTPKDGELPGNLVPEWQLGVHAEWSDDE